VCGIIGFLYKDLMRPVEEGILSEMCRRIHHRGPDEWGIWSDPGIGLGMKRLQIIDLEGGHQPMSTRENRYHIVFNGEIYNYIELRETLAARGESFETNSDTEVLLKAYVQFGKKCALMLRGMFAFAIWDNFEKSLFIARDRFGKKPLHYFDDGEKLVFGSEIKSLLAHPEVRAAVNRPAIIDYVSFGNTIDPHTMFEGIKKLPPGHTLYWTPKGQKVQKYWEMDLHPTEKWDKEALLSEGERVISEAVRVRLISDVPLGAFLSGGIDSSLVVALMATLSDEPVKTFSIGFEDPRFNELPYARMVASKFGTEHHEEIVTPNAETILPAIVDNFDEPFADSSAIPTYYVSRLARQFVTVALSGDGGDELFAGYTRYVDDPGPRRFDRLTTPGLRKMFSKLFSGALPPFFPGALRIRDYLAWSADYRYIVRMCKGICEYYSKVFSDELLRDIPDPNPASGYLKLLEGVGCADSISRRQYLDIQTYLPCDILTKVDRMSMLNSLECRSPLLDSEVAAFASRLPVSLKVQDETGKIFLKKLARKHLPRELLNRPKTGFAIPISHWINKEWLDISEDLVLGPLALSRGNFRKKFLLDIIREHRQETRDHSSLIWALMVLEMWYRKFIDLPVRGGDNV